MRALKKLFKSNYLFTLGVIICLAWIMAAILAPVIAPYDPIVQDLGVRLNAPSGEHWFGTDNFGRDIFSRVIYGGRYSLLAGVVTVILSGIIGTFYGAVAGYVGGQVDKLSGQLGSVSTQLGEAKGEIADKLEQLSVRLEEKSEEDIGDGLEEKFSAAEENVHKECVKVYRNVQAVVMEESGKQGEALAEMSGKVNAMKGKLGFVLGISVVALVFSLAGAVLQLLDLLGIGLL